MIDLKETARRAFEDALRRGKTAVAPSHYLDACSILKEIDEFQMADENKPSAHVPLYTEAQEELADILISCLTELHKRGTDVEAIIRHKMIFNQSRETKPKPKRKVFYENFKELIIKCHDII